MLDKATDFQVRRVVHGTGPDGKSTVLEDSLAVHRVETPAFTIVDLWRINSLPTSLENEDGLPDGVELTLPACLVCKVENGQIVRLDEYFDSARVEQLRAPAKAA